MNEWKRCNIYVIDYYSAIKLLKYAICINMDRSGEGPSKWNKSNKESQIS